MCVKTVHENHHFIVKDNGSDEIFVINKDSGIEIRIKGIYKGGIQITTEEIMTPWSVNGLPAIIVNPRNSI